MRFPRWRFTIRSLMIAVLVIAGLLALPDGWNIIVIALSIPGAAVIGGQWLAFRGSRRTAASCFWGLALLINLLYAISCIAPDSYAQIALFFAWMFIVAPTFLGLGAAWAFLATREGAVPRRSRNAAWLAVIALTVMPVLAPLTCWPLYLGFLMARPEMDRLADQFAAGQVMALPRWVGPYRLAGAAVDAATGHVGLMIDPDPNGPSGFVRARTEGSPGPGGPFVGSNLRLDLGGGWSYREDD